MLGIAVGSQSTVVGVKKGMGVDIVLSITSKRDNPTMVTYGNKNRFYGALSQEIMKSNIPSTVMYASRYLGLQPEWNNGEYLQEETKHSLCQPVIDNTFNRICFDINYKDKLEKYYPESVMGTYFNKLKSIFTGICSDDKDVCVTVPDYFTVNERQAMIDSVRVANLKLISLINESSANCLNYGMSRRGQFDDNNPRIVAFVDIGHSKTSVFFGQFGRNLQKVVSVTTERCLGARDFDYALVEYFSDMFQKKYGCNPMKNKKCVIRMIDFISKARKILTGNSETSINIESLMEDEDLSCIFKRSEFEQIVAPIVEKIKTVLNKALQESKYKLENIYSVEMVGDAVRTPIIQKVISEVFKKDVSKTLAPDESMAKGCTLFAALSSPFFQLKDYTFEHYNNYTIILQYPFLKDGKIETRHHKILKKGDVLPAKKTIKFNEKQLPNDPILNFKLCYDLEEISHLKNNNIRTYSVIIPKINTEKFEFVMNFSIDNNGIPSIDKATINEFTFEDVVENVDVKSKDKEDKSKMDIDSEAVTKKVKKEKAICCVVNLVEQVFGLNREVLEYTIDRENKQEKDDIDLKNVHAKRNEIEQFIYNTRNKLDDHLKPYIHNNEKTTLEKLMNDLENWFYSDDPNVENMKILEEKSNDLNKLGQTVYARLHGWENVNEAINNLNNLIGNIENRTNSDYEKFCKKDPNCFLTQKDFEDISSSMNIYKNKLKESTTSLSSGDKKDMPSINDKSINQYSEDLNKKVVGIYNNAENKYREAKRADEEKIKKEKEKLEKEKKAKEEAANKKKSDDKEGANKEKEVNNQPESNDINMDVD